MAEKKNNISCNAGRTKLVDPNYFGGQSSSSNLSVPLEDLTIAVILKTFKKGRTVLSADSSKGLVKTKTESTDDVELNFIDGSNINGKKVLTTRYTDLTTVFESDNNSEALGITSISIDFNSSFAPMVVINFIDIKGAAIFQNDKNIKSFKNKFSIFFSLPYPLFELTIKGYYGKPIKYCLHLTKFNTRFNSQTGNFEITTNFIGYTYAMLSDMLIGYLKAIPYTKVGKTNYEKINGERDADKQIIYLNDLMVKIAHINEGVTKLTATDPNAFKLKVVENQTARLTSLETNIKKLGDGIDIRKRKNNGLEYTYEYIVRPESQVTNDPNAVDGIDTYNKNIEVTINEMNAESASLMNIDDFKIVNTDTTKNPKNINIDSLTDANAKKYIEANKSVMGLSNTDKFDYWDLTKAYTAISETKTKLINQETVSKDALASSLEGTIKGIIGFSPTVRNIIEIFTTAVEVFMLTIYEISKNAETDVKRKTQLDQAFKTENNTDKQVGGPIHPWPDYREYIEKNDEGYVETYLGRKSPKTVVPKPEEITEIEFINDLFNAFIISQQKKVEAENITNGTGDAIWFPVNPLDTKLLGVDSEPYSRITPTTVDEVLVLVLIRAVTYLGYTNSKIDIKEIISMGENEGNAIIRGLKDDATNSMKTSISNMTAKDIIEKTKGKLKIGSTITDNKVIIGNNPYIYSYIVNDDDANQENARRKLVSVLPIDNGFNGAWNLSNDKDLVERATTTKFLTNYTNRGEDKPDDGGIYITIIPKSIYTNGTGTLPTTTSVIETTPLLYEKITVKTISNTKDAGFITTAGKYGISEFSNTIIEGNDLPLTFLFYYNYSFTNGIATDNPIQSIFDLSNKKFFVTPLNETYNRCWQKHVFKSAALIAYAQYKDLGKNKYHLKSQKNLVYPFINLDMYDSDSNLHKRVEVVDDNDLAEDKNSYSLLGSKWYYGQKTFKAKALLFLNSLPWYGMPFDSYAINHLFDINAGFILAPRLWCAFVGGLLWRAYSSSDPISWTFVDKNNRNFPLLPTKNSFLTYPSTKQFINELQLNVDDATYNNIPPIMLYMPEQARNEFIRIFQEFVDGDWLKLEENIRIVNGDLNNFLDVLQKLYDKIDRTTATHTLTKKDVIDSGIINIEKYRVITTNGTNGDVNVEKPRAIFLEFNPKTTGYNPSSEIIRMLQEEVYIANNYPHIWTDTNNTNKYREIIINNSGGDDILEKYLTSMIDTLKKTTNPVAAAAQKQQTVTAIFGNSNEDIVKLLLYRTCKNIYDKWIGGATNPNDLIFSCGQGSRHKTDAEVAKKSGNNGAPKLIDSFRFLDRAFSDIGDKLYINPTPVNEYLINGTNTSFYDAIGHLLASNHFEFIALPSFINYNDDEVLGSVFTPYPKYENVLESSICGPSFICTYVGQTSKHLDFAESNYSNDGIDFHCDKTNDKFKNIPKDMQSVRGVGDSDVAVFAVNYGQQNQNIFKDITLDQSEFSETDESLKVTDDIANKGAQTSISLAGQNIYNVYSVRSYKAEIEMLGNAMIQPMMHFQLNNIPMFHGGYLITRVKHEIKPNHMSTSFTGVRIRFPKTRLIESSEFYMSLLDSIANNLSNAKGNGTTAAGNIGLATRSAKASIPCGGITSSVVGFDNVLPIIIQYLEGYYCPGGISCGSDNSGETLWGLDRKNHNYKDNTGKITNKKRQKYQDDWWLKVDKLKNGTSTTKKFNNEDYPKITDQTDLYSGYNNIIKYDYDSYSKSYLKNTALKTIIEGDGRLFLNMIYAAYNGSGHFKNYVILLDTEFKKGTTTADGLLKVFVDNRIAGGYYVSSLIADTGLDIQKLVGLNC